MIIYDHISRLFRIDRTTYDVSLDNVASEFADLLQLLMIFNAFADAFELKMAAYIGDHFDDKVIDAVFKNIFYKGLVYLYGGYGKHGKI